MKKLFLLAFSLSCLLAEETWLETYIHAEEDFLKERWREAAEKYTKVMDKTEKKLFLFARRGFCYEMQKKNDEALKDYTYVVCYPEPQMEIDAVIQALWGRVRIYLTLDKTDKFKEDYKNVVLLDPNFPKMEQDGKYIVWRNINSNLLNSYLKEKYADTLIQAGVCKNKADVRFLETGVAIIKITKPIKEG